MVTRQDPGWSPALRHYAWFLGRRGAIDAEPPITRQRLLFMVFLAGLTLVILVLALLGDAPGDVEPVIAMIFILATGVVSWLGIAGMRRRPWEVRDEEAAVARFHRDLMIGVALAELPALVAFVFYFMTGALATYLVGYAVSLALFAMVAPTAGSVARANESLAAGGSPVDLAAALYRTPGTQTVMPDPFGVDR